MNPEFVKDDKLVKKYIHLDLFYLVDKTRSEEYEDGDVHSSFDLLSGYAVIHRIPPRVAVPPIKKWDIQFMSHCAEYIDWPTLALSPNRLIPIA